MPALGRYVGVRKSLDMRQCALEPRLPRRQLISSADLGILSARVRFDCGATLSGTGDMERDEAIGLLKRKPAGVEEWNIRRESGERIPDLSGADLKGADLTMAQLSEANLSDADLSAQISSVPNSVMQTSAIPISPVPTFARPSSMVPTSSWLTSLAPVSSKRNSAVHSCAMPTSRLPSSELQASGTPTFVRRTSWMPVSAVPT